MSKGKFIVIEGGDGSGKGSCIKRLREAFGHDPSVVFTREPGGTNISEQIRDILMSKENEGMTVITELLLFCASRAQHCEELIAPAVALGRNVICDRFEGSTYAYQICGRERGSYADMFKAVNAIARQSVRPDLVVYLDVDPNIALARRAEEGVTTRFDVEAVPFHQRVREGYLQMAKEDGWVVVDASLPKEVVQNQTLDIVRAFLERSCQ